MSELATVMPEPAAALIAAVGWALFWFVAQGTLIGLLVAAFLHACRHRSADLRYGIAGVGLLTLAICPFVTTLRGLSERKVPTIALPTSTQPDAYAAPATVSERTISINAEPLDAIRPPDVGPSISSETEGMPPVIAPSAQSVSRWRDVIEARLPAIVAAWLIGVGLLSLRLISGLIGIRRLTSRGLLSPTDAYRAMIVRLMDRSRLSRPVSWFLSERVEVPTVAGWLRPVVLIPAGNLARLTARQIEALLAHEIAHIRRHDYLVNVCQAAIEALLFFHPAVWWVSRRLRIERENCCDDMAAVLCGGDRLLVARALFALEEQRGSPVLRIAATGGSLRDRVRRLIAPGPRPEGAGWAGAVLIVAAAALAVIVGLPRPNSVQAGFASRAEVPSIRGRVIDEAGKAVGGARARLYRRDSRFERRTPVVEEVKTGADGRFEMRTALEARPLSQTRGYPPFVIVADHPGKAVGWRTIPLDTAAFDEAIVLTPPSRRKVFVVDAEGHPVAGAKVFAYGVGDPSSPSPLFQDFLDIRPDDGPLTTTTDAEGRATLEQIPRTDSSLAASKSGLAENFAFHDQEKIRLTPSATLSGRLVGPDGLPLPGIKVVLHASFLWHFYEAVTDEQGRYHFAELMASGWDKGAWKQTEPGDGKYKLWIQDDRFAIPTETIVLGPKQVRTLDLQAVEAGTIRVTLTEEETGAPVADVPIGGFDEAEHETGRRFNAYTDANGVATLHSAPAKLSLIASLPAGVFIDGGHEKSRGMSKMLDFAGGDAEIALVIPKFAGKLTTVSGACLAPPGVSVRDISVHASAGQFQSSGATSYVRHRQTDDFGRFHLEGVPGGRPLQLYAETKDRQYAGAISAQSPAETDPQFQARVTLVRTVAVQRILLDENQKPLASRSFLILPQVGEETIHFVRRTVTSDESGEIRMDGIVPGLTYHVQELVESRGRTFVSRANGRPPWFEEVMVLAPKEDR